MMVEVRELLKAVEEKVEEMEVSWNVYLWWISVHLLDSFSTVLATIYSILGGETRVMQDQCAGVYRKLRIFRVKKFSCVKISR